MTEAASKIMGNDSRKGKERQTGLGAAFSNYCEAFHRLSGFDESFNLKINNT